MSHHMIEIKNVCFRYPQGNEVIKDVSFRITHGESVGLIGANGAGKSTLLMLLSGLLIPTNGDIIIGETKLTKKTLKYIRQRIGYCFQNPDDQLFMNTVYDDVAFGPRNYGIDEIEIEKRVDKALERVGALHLKNKFSYKLSGGEKRMVSIATVLSMEPDILLMDEPSSFLDPGARRKLINVLNSFEHTKIIATHDLDLVLETCKRTILLKNGEVVFDGNTKDILTDKKLLEECGLELPFCLQTIENPH